MAVLQLVHKAPTMKPMQLARRIELNLISLPGMKRMWIWKPCTGTISTMRLKLRMDKQRRPRAETLGVKPKERLRLGWAWMTDLHPKSGEGKSCLLFESKCLFVSCLWTRN